MDKAHGSGSDDPNYKTPIAEARAAMREVNLMSRLSYLSREVIGGIDQCSDVQKKAIALESVVNTGRARFMCAEFVDSTTDHQLNPRVFSGVGVITSSGEFGMRLI
ncbi:hypothetical protein [Orrella daihaiensis]|uniref:Uncharacterized protein n=1 Tax=Orrella daihaiensis TaxID=2782176 RepID=A0ABY4AMX7_9BURK|nr:hypothetical protein [Orrella daihaiensis]UOD50425.1 hypothetical protein DHf2319_00305 [Orrella daihaiensis]